MRNNPSFVPKNYSSRRAKVGDQVTDGYEYYPHTHGAARGAFMPNTPGKVTEVSEDGTATVQFPNGQRITLNEGRYVIVGDANYSHWDRVFVAQRGGTERGAHVVEDRGKTVIVKFATGPKVEVAKEYVRAR